MQYMDYNCNGRQMYILLHTVFGTVLFSLSSYMFCETSLFAPQVLSKPHITWDLQFPSTKCSLNLDMMEQ